MSTPASTTYAVRFRSIRKYVGARRTTYTVRWTVGGRDWQKTFATAKLADGHRSGLMSSAHAGEPFDLATGLPAPMSPPIKSVSWLEHCIDFLRMKWPDAAPKYRKSLAESLTVITLGLLTSSARQPATASLRKALYGWAYGLREPDDAPAEVKKALAWLHDHSRPVGDLIDHSIVRDTLETMSMTLDGRRASNATVARRRSAFHSCLDYAVERGRLSSNPLKEIKRKRLPPVAAVDRRRVVNPRQARALLTAVRRNDPELEAFFALLYYAGPRPGEALNLRRRDCTLPEHGWGHLLLRSSYQRTGSTWTDSGDVGEERQLKHRADEDTRPVPIYPELVKILRRHCDAHQIGPDERLFTMRTSRSGRTVGLPRNRPISMSTIYRAWHRAREAALGPDELNSPLARRPYDLRHACLSTWINAGVELVRIAEWAGHSVNVLLSTYAKCIDGQEQIALDRIEQALNAT